MWNGEQLYRRCYTQASTVTADTIIANWETGLKPKKAMSLTTDIYVVASSLGSTNGVVVSYNTSTGTLFADVVGTGRVLPETSFCIEYTK